MQIFDNNRGTIFDAEESVPRRSVFRTYRLPAVADAPPVPAPYICDVAKRFMGFLSGFPLPGSVQKLRKRKLWEAVCSAGRRRQYYIFTVRELKTYLGLLRAYWSIINLLSPKSNYKLWRINIKLNITPLPLQDLHL